MNKFNILLLVTLLIANIANAENAHKGKSGSHESNKIVRTRINASLDSANIALADLANAKGSVKYDIKSRKDKIKEGQLKVSASFPLPAPSVGMNDIASASGISVHFEVSRADVVIADCSMAFQQPDNPSPSKASFRLHVKAQGKKNVKGSCSAGIPLIQSGDSIKVYATVSDVRVDALDNVKN